MTTLYTGTPYGGQNNLTVQGCFHALITHATSPAKALAAQGLKIYQAKAQGTVTVEQAHTNAQSLINQLNTIDPADRTMLEWALRTL